MQTKSHFSSLPSAIQQGTILGSNSFTYAHELAHQWFGNAVTLRRWNDIWFNEGWAQLAEWEYGHELAGDPETPAEQFDALYADPAFDWSIAPAVLDGDPANLFLNDPTYARGGMTLQAYREILGDDDLFFAFAKQIQQRFRYGNISTAAVRRLRGDLRRLRWRAGGSARGVLRAVAVRDHEADDHPGRLLARAAGPSTTRVRIPPLDRAAPALSRLLATRPGDGDGDDRLHDRQHLGDDDPVATSGSRDTGAQWLVTGYALSTAAFIALGGRLGDIIGHKRIVVIGISLFAGSSLVCGLTPDTGIAEAWLILFRVLQGIGGALLIPSTTVLVLDAFPDRASAARVSRSSSSSPGCSPRSARSRAPI